MGRISNEERLDRDRAYLRTANRREMERSLLGFTVVTYPGHYDVGWFHLELCDLLDRFLVAVAEKRSPRIIVTVPPRHGKSELISRRFPAYALGKYPDLNVISCSYSDDLVKRFSRDVQRIMDSAIYRSAFPDVVLPRSEAVAADPGRSKLYTRTADLFELPGHKGSYRAAGVGSGITGMGADCLIIDDPIKDDEQARSANLRQSLWNWYTSTAYTRLSPGGGVIVVMTRWHMDDLVGRLLAEQAEGGDKWEVFDFPAIAEREEPHRHIGEPLHPERYDLTALAAIKAAVGTRVWSALYQCRPVPDGGGIIHEDWIQYYDTPPKDFEKIVMSWDMTFKDADTSDFVVGQVWGRVGSSFYLLDQVRGRWSFVDTVSRVVALCQKWPRATRRLIEDKANGSAVIDVLRRQVPGIIPITPKDSKEARCNAVSTLFEAHNVVLPSPRRAPWIRDYVGELIQFPAGAHDDQVDATTQALADLRTGGRIHAANILALAGVH